MADYSDLVSQFLANGGEVQRVSEGTRAIESDRAIYRAMREGGKVAADSEMRAREAEKRHHEVRDHFDELRYNGVDTATAYKLAQE